MSKPDANSPAPLGETTVASENSQKEATYLPPDDLAAKYAKGIQRHYPAQPHATFTAKSEKNPHLIKKIDK
jgi:galactonate dehydratase